MSMTEWAKREIEIAIKKERGDGDPNEWDYGCACYESAYKAFLSLCEDKHSGYSIGFTKEILNRLIDGKPLTPIEDVPDVWSKITCLKNECTAYQCKRMSSLFKHVYTDGTVKYNDIDRYICVNKDRPRSSGWCNGFINRLLDEKYPITMPYCPPTKPFVVYCTEGLSDPKNGDFDTIGIWYVDKPNGERDVIERFFKDDENGSSYIEIDRQEYEKRMKKDKNWRSETWSPISFYILRRKYL